MDAEVFNMLFEFFENKHQMQPPVLMDSSISESRITDKNLATGRTLYFGLDKNVDKKLSKEVPKDYILEELEQQQQYDDPAFVEEGCDEPVKEIVSPAKSTPRAVSLVQKAAPQLNVQINNEGQSCQAHNSDDDTVPVTPSRRCSDYYSPKLSPRSKKARKDKKEVAKKVEDNNDDWFKQHLIETRAERKEELKMLCDVLKSFAPKKSKKSKKKRKGRKTKKAKKAKKTVDVLKDNSNTKDSSTDSTEDSSDDSSDDSTDDD